jgi:hypothetical protein
VLASGRSPNQSATSRSVWQRPEGVDELARRPIVSRTLGPGELLAELPSGTEMAVKDYRASKRGDALFNVWRSAFVVRRHHES